ncbi:MAG: ArsA family ATPase [Oligoflexia bacterium]|nr:ArsA family ATPase [Oligoflexia bacterium]
MDLSSQKIVFVTGKGGVGKSVCAASIAWAEARKGRRVCLVELGSQSFYESFFETRGISYEPSEVIPDVHIALYTPQDCLREYVLHFLKVPKLYDIFFQNKVMKAFLNASPALAELSILGKLTSDIRGILPDDYDLYVVDCYSTGHAMALFRAPEGLSAIFKSGPLHDQARDIAQVLKNPEQTHYVLVTLPEEMPITEAEEFYSMLKTEQNAQISVICNKLIAPPLTRSEQVELTKSVKDQNMHEFLEYIQFKEKNQDQQLARLAKLSTEYYGVPLILDSLSSQDCIAHFATHLEKPWILTNS